MTIIHKIFFKLRYYHDLLYPEIEYLDCIKESQKSSDIIYEKLTSSEPCMIARYGSVELYALSNYLGIKKGWNSCVDFIRGKSEPWWWIPKRLFELKNNAGFFSADNIELVEKYCDLLLKDTDYLDVLASWVDKEVYLKKQLNRVDKIFLPYLEPYWAEKPWTRALEGKKVLVVHPFTELISHQYHNNRKNLFRNSQVLPVFELKTLKSVQSIGGDGNGFTTWFEALDWMKAEIDKIDYDICIIGCGAYGFHLAAHVKRMGKKAIHMGGATQLLFGIKGKRWEDSMYGVKEWNLPYGFYTEMFNEYWIKPGQKERPLKADSVEGACYW